MSHERLSAERAGSGSRNLGRGSVGNRYDGAQAITELKGSSLDTVYHTGLEIDEVLARYAPLGNRTPLTDALMSVIAQANDDETVSNYYAYSPYGETAVLGPDEGNALQYTGRENDGTGLYYYRARYYEPQIKRFIGEDPLGWFGGINLYQYVNGNPVSLSDPLGKLGLGGVAIVVGGGAAAAGLIWFRQCLKKCEEYTGCPFPDDVENLANRKQWLDQCKHRCLTAITELFHAGTVGDVTPTTPKFP